MTAAKQASADTIGGISTEAVKKATGRTWAQWLSALDKAGCREQDHKSIVKAVAKIDADVSGWWQQQVTVGYEQARGLRVKHEKPGGFEVSVSRTVNVPIAAAYRAWSDGRTRKKWLDEAVRVRTSTANKSIRFDWADGKTRINVYLVEKGPSRTQVTAQHVALASAKQAEAAKQAWRPRLDALKAMLKG